MSVIKLENMHFKLKLSIQFCEGVIGGIAPCDTWLHDWYCLGLILIPCFLVMVAFISTTISIHEIGTCTNKSRMALFVMSGTWRNHTLWSLYARTTLNKRGN